MVNGESLRRLPAERCRRIVILNEVKDLHLPSKGKKQVLRIAQDDNSALPLT